MIEIFGLEKSFKDKPVLTGVDLKIDTGETLAIIGKSGCGKSVLLKHIVGLLFPDSGKVFVEGKELGKMNAKEIYKLRKKFGFLFQGAALFDSMTVGENVGLPLVENQLADSNDDIARIVADKLSLVGLKNIEHLKPSELSGGMKKRVGLARALVTEPDYILYDEPTTGLDPVMSDSIDDLIKELNDKLEVTSIVVTHDMTSVKNVADRVAMLHDGKVYFNGTPTELVDSKDDTVVNFIKRTGY